MAARYGLKRLIHSHREDRGLLLVDANRVLVDAYLRAHLGDAGQARSLS
jgi:hypothetical protein